VLGFRLITVETSSRYQWPCVVNVFGFGNRADELPERGHGTALGAVVDFQQAPQVLIPIEGTNVFAVVGDVSESLAAR